MGHIMLKLASKIGALFTVVAFAAINGIFTTEASAESCAENKLCLYENEYSAGRSLGVDQDISDLRFSLYSFNDKASSASNADIYNCYKLYQHISYQGTWVVLRPRGQAYSRISRLDRFNLNDQVSSIKKIPALLPGGIKNPDCYASLTSLPHWVAINEIFP
ncbi:peptidase inhibitor family I36 protein [Lentzea sp. NEAU-D7]|uniref:peptidase inhibitor family I36 protein n=1 Tax=Lentzea sp. NEAU-D7 TaxID=2994667 RepID=UPI00224B10DE|nr:peptidase inhibitor family I36 protein [Lentzea sp. NEAU-D7]MCX2952824.1 peptidase inhibitor family I36 protein [Lentzea sp. NEAU-D7]